MIKLDLTGRIFGRLTVIEEVNKKGRDIEWVCKCCCGNTVTVRRSSLMSERTKSCGCLWREKQTTHNASKTPEYRVWQSMKQRCNNAKAYRYKDYGERGIVVCDRWNSFECFFEDMGQRPSISHSVDRIDNDGNYEPGNCKWSTRSEQQRNKRPIKDNNNLKRGDDHWTRKDTEKAKKIAIKNIKKAHHSGEENNNSKLTKTTAKQLREIHKLFPDKRMDELGSLFGVGRETARKVIRGISW